MSSRNPRMDRYRPRRSLFWAKARTPNPGGTIADDEEMDIPALADDLLGGLDEDIVAFIGPEISDHGDGGDIFIGQAQDGPGPVPPL